MKQKLIKMKQIHTKIKIKLIEKENVEIKCNFKI